MIGAGPTAIGGAAVTTGIDATGMVTAAVAAGPFFFLPVMWVALMAQGLSGDLVSTTVIGDDGRRLRVVTENLQHTRFTVEQGDRLRLRLQHIGGRS